MFKGIIPNRARSNPPASAGGFSYALVSVYPPSVTIQKIRPISTPAQEQARERGRIMLAVIVSDNLRYFQRLYDI